MIIKRDRRPLTAKDIQEIEKIKNQFNSKRTTYDFSHLWP